MNLIIYQADVVGKQNNCLYPHRREVTNADELAAAVAMDHVCAEYQNNYRNNDISLFHISCGYYVNSAYMHHAKPLRRQAVLFCSK